MHNRARPANGVKVLLPLQPNRQRDCLTWTNRLLSLVVVMYINDCLYFLVSNVIRETSPL